MSIRTSGSAQHQLPTPGSSLPSLLLGTPGRIAKDVTVQINPVGPLSIVVHPLVGRVTVTGTTAAAASVSVVGRDVTLVASNAGTTTVAAMQALIAASPAASLLTISGNPADTFGAAWSLSTTNLWDTGTLPANALIAMGPDGYLWPVEMTDYRLKVRADGYNSAADAQQVLPIAGDPPRINGPATFISVSAAVIANGTTQYVLPCAMYGRSEIQIVWTCAGTTLLQFNAYGKYDNAAWAAAGSIPSGYLINNQFQHTGNAVFGAPPVGGATTNVIKARLQDPDGYDSIAIEMVASNSGGNSTVTGTYRLTGGTA